MKKVVIIGAGPVGLYLAYRLKQEGANVIVYDPQAGEYTRPGHLNEYVFRKIEKNLKEKFWNGDYGHIKDIQRILHTLVTVKGTPIEKKKFVGH